MSDLVVIAFPTEAKAEEVRQRHRLLQLPRGADKRSDTDRVPFYVTNLWRRTLQRRSQKTG